jgi:hypothetical protein
MASKRSKIVYNAFFLAERVEIADGLQKRPISQMRAFAGHSRGCGFWVGENGLGARCVGVDSVPDAGPVLLRLCAHSWRARVRGRAVVCCVVGLFTPPAYCAPGRPASSGASQTRARAPKFVFDLLHCQPSLSRLWCRGKPESRQSNNQPDPKPGLVGRVCNPGANVCQAFCFWSRKPLAAAAKECNFACKGVGKEVIAWRLRTKSRDLHALA